MCFKIAACLNLNHYPTPFEPGYINGHFERILEETGGMVSVDHGHAIHPLKHLRRLSPGIAIPGLNGEYGRAFWPVYSSHSDRISPEDMAQKLFKMEMITRDSRYEILFEHETASMIESCFENYVRRYNEAAECACFNHPVAWNDEFYLRDRVRSFSAFGGNIWSSFFSLECPYLEENYIQSVRSLPPKLRTAPLIHIEIIKRLHPKLLRLPLYPSCKPLQKHWYDFAANAIRRSVAGRKGRKGTQRYAQWLRDEACFLEPYVLKAHESFCGFVRADVVKRLWMEHQAGLDHHRILCRLMTPAMVDDLYM